MQIFPLLQQSNQAVWFEGKDILEADQEKNFSLLFQEEQGKTTFFESHLQDKEQLQNTPRTQHIFTLAENCEKFSQTIKEEDFSQIREELASYGVSKEKLSLLEEKVKKGELTWAKLLHCLDIKISLNLSKVDRLDKEVILGFLQKIGFSDDESKKMFLLLSKGKIKRFVKNVFKRIEKLPKNHEFKLSYAELKAFSSLLGIKNSLHIQLKPFHGTLDQSGFKNFILTFYSLAQKKLDFSKITLKNVDDNKILILKRIFSVLKKDELESSSVKMRNKDKYINAKKEDKEIKILLSAKDSQSKKSKIKIFQEQTLDSKVHLKSTEIENGKELIDYRHTQSHTKNLKLKKTGEKNFQKKIQEKLDILGINNKGLDKKIEIKQGQNFSKLSRHIWSQVESGILQNISKGNARIILKLDPPDLGQVGLILQVNKNEVSLLLKTSHEETGNILNQHIHQLKAHLEQQGFKVQKLEVKANLQESNQFSFAQNGENHQSMKRELFKQRIFLARQNYFTRGNLANDVLYREEEEIFSTKGISLFA